MRLSPLRAVWVVKRGLAAAAAVSVSAVSAGTVEAKQERHRGRTCRIVLYTDLDGTLVGDDAAQRAFEKYWEEVERPKGSVLVYNTARSIVAYHKLATKHQLPQPDVLITGEGTEIRWLKNGFQLDQAWSDGVHAAWTRSGVAARARALCDRHDEGHLSGLNAVANAPPLGESRLALTIMDRAKAERVADDIRLQLGDRVTVTVMTAWGPDPPALVTIMPAMAGKGHAAQFVHRSLGADRSEALCAGDTLGDVAVLSTDFAVVLVGNATQELLDARTASPPSASYPDPVGGEEMHYVAEACFAAGVLEGLKRHRQLLEIIDF